MRNYQNKSNQGALPDSITATRFGAGEFNSIAVELENAVTTSGQSLAPADGIGEINTQLAAALSIYGSGGAQYHTDSGVVNAYVLTPVGSKASPPSYFDGFTVVFEPGTTNTSVSTVNVNSLGVKQITLQNKMALLGGEIFGTTCLKFNSSTDSFELIYNSNQFYRMSKFYEVDPLQADQGITSTNPSTMTIYDIAILVGTSKRATIHLSHYPTIGNQTLYTFDTSLDLSSYPLLHFDFDHGAFISRTTGDEILTINSPNNIDAQSNQQITGVDVFRFSSPGTVYADWYGDDVTAIQYAGNSIITNGGKLRLNSKTYDGLTAQVAWSTAARFKIEGAGRGQTILNWTDSATSGGGISLTYTDYWEPPTVTGLTLQTNGFDVGTALYVKGVDPGTAITIIGPRIYDISTRGVVLTTDCWKIGIEVSAAWFPEIYQFDCKGMDDATSPFDQDAGLVLSSCQAPFIHDFTIFHIEYGIVEQYDGITNRGEGFNIQTFEIVGVSYGIYFNGASVMPGTSISDGHINAYVEGIHAINRYQMSIHDMLIYKTNVSTSNFTGIYMYNCDSCHIHDNEIHGSSGATGDTYGITLSGTTESDRNTIHDNHFRYFYGTFKYGIVYGNGAGSNLIHHNHGDSTLTSITTISGTPEVNNIFFNNFPFQGQSLAINDTTPSVGNDRSGFWGTQNTVSTTVTTFDDGRVGQQIIVLLGDANTTIAHGTGNIILDGGTNITTIGSTVMLIYDGSYWRAIGQAIQ